MKYCIQSFAVLFALALFIPTYSNAQTQPDDPTTRKKKKEKPPRYELVYDLLWLIDKNTFPATSLMGRYHFKQTETKGMALRVRVGGGYDHSKVYNDIFSPNLDFDISSRPFVATRVGLEWQRKWSKIQLVYGSELEYAYSNQMNQKGYPVVESSGTIQWFVSDTHEKTTSTGIILFMGIKIPIYRSIAIYGESNLAGQISKYHALDNYYTNENYPTGNSFGRSDLRIDNFSLKTTLLSTIGLSFTF